jgi:hypothetical protein
MKKLNIFVTAIMVAVTTAGAFAQVIPASEASLFSPIPGGARILSAQGNTAANPAIGFQSTASTTGTAQNDGGGGNGIFRPAANVMAFSTSSTERMRISPGGAIGIGTSAPTALLHTLGNVRLQSLPSSTVNTMVISTDANGNLSYQSASSLFPSSTSWLLGGNYPSASDFIGTLNSEPFKIFTVGTEKARITPTGEMGIGTVSPTAQLEVTSIPTLGPTAIKGFGKTTGIYGEASEMTVGQTSEGIAGGTAEAIGVFGKGLYTSHVGNSTSYGVVGSAAVTNPQNNAGVYGEAKNASGYNWGVRGSANSTVGDYNTGVAGEVILNTTAQWNRAVSGYAPVAPNHFAGYFEGKVAIVDGTQANNYVLTSDANGLATWTNPASIITSSADWSLTGNSGTNPATNFIGTTDTIDLKIKTNNNERAIIKATGEVGIGTSTPTAQLEVTSVPTLVQTGIKSKGINTGVYGEATDMNAPLTDEGTLAGHTEAIGVFGKGTYASNISNGNIFGVVGSATASTNPLNNIGVYGEAKNATGYNTGVYGGVTYGGASPIKGIYNSGVSGRVDLNTTAVWNRAINAYAPVAVNHYAGYFDGNVDMQSGTVRIGNVTTPVGYKLYVEKGILTEKVQVAVAGSLAWADYVFAKDYQLKPLAEVESYINANKHLPNIPSSSELVKGGLDLGQMQAKQMEKIEELTLYMIEMKKEIETLKKENQLLKVSVSPSK